MAANFRANGTSRKELYRLIKKKKAPGSTVSKEQNSLPPDLIFQAQDAKQMSSQDVSVHL